MQQISILFADDAEKWSQYLTQRLYVKTLKDHIHIEQLNITAYHRNLRKYFNESAVVVPLLSPCMIDHVMDGNTNLMEILKSYTNVVLIECFAEEEDKKRLCDKYPVIKTKTMKKVTLEQKENIQIVLEILEAVDNASESCPPFRRVSKQRGREVKFCLIPSTIYETHSAVSINFEEKISGTVTISYGKCGDKRRGTNPYNPYSVLFKTNDLEQGVNIIYVFINDKAVGHRELKYTSPVLESFQCPSYACQLLGIGLNDIATLDKRLSILYQASVPEDHSLHKLLTINPCGVLPELASNAEVPTLLHFAAKYGLSELCSLLLNTPGSINAYYILNVRNMDPCELAEESGFHELANYITTFLETEAVVHVCDSLYVNTQDLHRENAGHGSTTQETSSLEADVTPPALPPKFSQTEEHNQFCGRSIDNRSPEPQQKPNMVCSRSQKSNSENYSNDMWKHCQALAELLDINKQTSEGQFTIDEANRLYHSWQDRNRNSSLSIRQKNKNLRALREQYQNVFKVAQNKDTNQGVLARFRKMFSKAKPDPIMEISEPLPAKPLRPNLQTSPGRASCSSTSSFASFESRGSHMSIESRDSNLGTSPNESEEDIPGEVQTRRSLENICEEHNKRAALSKRTSFREQFLQNIETTPETELPPEIPPRTKAPPVPPKR